MQGFRDHIIQTNGILHSPSLFSLLEASSVIDIKTYSQIIILVQWWKVWDANNIRRFDSFSLNWFWSRIALSGRQQCLLGSLHHLVQSPLGQSSSSQVMSTLPGSLLLLSSLWTPSRAVSLSWAVSTLSGCLHPLGQSPPSLPISTHLTYLHPIGQSPLFIPSAFCTLPCGVPQGSVPGTTF